MATEKQQKEQQQLLRKEAQNRRRKRRTRQLLGFVLSILIVVGAVSIVSGASNLVKDLRDHTAEYDDYAKRVEPLVWFDLLPFDSLETADPNALKQVAIWGVLNDSKTAIELTEKGEPMIPAIEIDQYAKALFGPDYKIEHGAFEDQVENLVYTYDEESEMYTAPATGLTPQYLGEVVDIERQAGGVKRVTVGYISTTGSNNELVAAADLKRAVKYMDYFFRKGDGGYYLFALQNNTTHVVSDPDVPSMIEPSDIPDDAADTSASQPPQDTSGSAAE